MNDYYHQISELIDKCLSLCAENAKMAFIEKEIVLEKIRNLYTEISKTDTQEYEAAAQPVNISSENQQKSPKREFAPAKTLEEDVDLFFDTDHESYNNFESEEKSDEHFDDKSEKDSEDEIPNNEQNDAELPANEIEETAESIDATIDEKEEIDNSTNEVENNESSESIIEEPNNQIDKTELEINTLQQDSDDSVQVIEEKDDIDSDIFDNLEIDPEVEVEDILKDDEDELFAEEDFTIFNTEETIEPQILQNPVVEKVKTSEQTPAPNPENKNRQEQISDEDDILKFAQNQSKTNIPKIEQPQRSLNDLFNGIREDNSISGQYQRAKVGDLTKAISINDKFIYIKELFHNRGEDFSDALKQLNNCKDLSDAFDCLENLKQKYYWDSTSDAYLSFCDLLRRKYS